MYKITVLSGFQFLEVAAAYGVTSSTSLILKDPHQLPSVCFHVWKPVMFSGILDVGKQLLYGNYFLSNNQTVFAKVLAKR